MDTTQQIQRFPFKTLGNNAGTNGASAQGFTPFPYKATATAPTANNAAQSSGTTAQTIEKEQPKAPSFSEKDIQEAKQKAFEDGYAKGYNGAKSAEAETQKIIQSAISDITLKLTAIGEVVKTKNTQHVKELAELVAKIARKVSGNCIAVDPYGPIENVIKESLPLLFDEQKITVCVHPDLVQEIESRITGIAKNKGFRNIISIAAKPELPPGSCEIEWTGGGLKSNKDTMWSQIDNLVDGL